MARKRRYIETDVLAEARKRIHHVYDIFDSVVVMFSGGKDSLALLNLTWEVAQERGLSHVDVVFRDEELIPATVIDFVESYRLKPWVRMLWFAVPLKSKKYVLGRTYSYVQWDRARRHVRPLPAHAIQLPAGDDRVFDQYTMDSHIAAYFRGRCAFMTGIRAAESLMRMRSVMNKLNENYITDPVKYGPGIGSPKNVQMVKPIYDWEENDVFRYFFDQGIAYCPHYDRQLWAGVGLRVSTPLHAESAKQFHTQKVVDPDLYAQMIDVFPEMLAHERYYRELDTDAVRDQYGHSLAGVWEWITENITDPDELKLATRRFRYVEGQCKVRPEVFPPRYVLSAFLSGGYKREIMPKKVAA